MPCKDDNLKEYKINKFRAYEIQVLSRLLPRFARSQLSLFEGNTVSANQSLHRKKVVQVC